MEEETTSETQIDIRKKTLTEVKNEFNMIQLAKLQEIINMKNKGWKDETVADRTGFPVKQVATIYKEYIKSSIEDLAQQKSIIALQNMVYRKRLAEAEEQYEKAKQISEAMEGKLNTNVAVAAWHKIVVETADSYTGYLAKIGAINTDTYKQFQLEDEIKKEKSPLEILIEANRKKLMEEIEAVKTNELPTTTETAP